MGEPEYNREYEGTVTNVTDYGIYVDIGLDSDVLAPDNVGSNDAFINKSGMHFLHALLVRRICLLE